MSDYAEQPVSDPLCVDGLCQSTALRAKIAEAIEEANSWRRVCERYAVKLTAALALIRKMQGALEVGAKTLQSVEVFVKSKEKIKDPEGHLWFSEQQKIVSYALDEATAFLKEREGE